MYKGRMYSNLRIKRTLLSMAILAALPSLVLAQETHLDIMVPDLKDTDLSGPVKSVDTKVSMNVSGKFEREHHEYDRVGNLLSNTEWNPDGECINTMTNYYSENGTFERQLYMDYGEEGFTNDCEVVLNPETHQVALREKKKKTVSVYTYSPEGYLVKFRYVDRDKKLVGGSNVKRDEQNRRKFQEDLLGLVQNENKTFIFVTHSIEEAVYVSDQIAILLPRPSRVSEIIRPSGFRHKDHDQIRRDPEYLDIVDDIWASLRSYVE